VRKATVGLIVVCIVLLWALSPILIADPSRILTLTVTPGATSECPVGSACFTVQLQNRGPWPITVHVTELQFYPSLTGPSIEVNWLGPKPDDFLLTPFSGHSYILWIKIMEGLGPPDRVYVVLSADVTVLYIFHHTVLHSGKR
jgi:hypothetical protein